MSSLFASFLRSSEYYFYVDEHKGLMTAAPILCVVDFDAVRDALRREREARVGSRAKLEDLSGVSESTIFKIETKWLDPRTKKAYTPGADQLLRLLDALPAITISEFFAQIEALNPADATLTVTPRPDVSVTQDPRGALPDAHDLSARERAAAHVQETIAASFAKHIVAALDRLVEARTQDRNAEQPPAAPVRRAGRRR